MSNNEAILHATTIDGNGFGRNLIGEEVSELIKGDSLAWVHLDATHEGAEEWLKAEVPYLDQIIVEALLADETRPRIVEFEEGVLLILRGVNFNEGEDHEDMVSLRLWIDSHRIISLRRRRLKAVMDIADRLKSGKGPKNSGEFISMLTSRLFERMEPIFQELDERLDDIEEKIIESPDISERSEVTQIRKKAILFRRYISPQKDVIAQLRTSEQFWIDITEKRRIQETLDRIIRYVEDIDSIRERAQIIKDELANILSDRMNKNLYMLSVIAAIFLPLGFLTGLLGVNVGGIPGSDNPNAFILFCLILSIVVLIQIIWFRVKGWL